MATGLACSIPSISFTCAFKILVRRSEGKKQLGKPRHRWEGNIKINFKEVGVTILIGFIWLKIGTSDGIL
jgi:hypothetical protein